MKAISIRQPWAWLIIEGYKPIENRNWPTNFRGDIQIHAAKGCTQQEYDDAVAFVRSFNPAIASRIPSLDKLEKGGIIGIVRITDCVSQSQSPWFVGKFGFVMTRPYPVPFRPMRGMLGIFNVNTQGEPEEIANA
jgi:hypothetical protein